MKKTRIVVILAIFVLVLATLASCDLLNGATDDTHGADDHVFVGGVCSCGATDPNYLPPCTHKYKNGSCEMCGEACVHDFGEFVSLGDASCITDGTKQRSCKICGAVDTAIDEGSATGHSFTNYISDNNATCTADGTKSAKCDDCDATDTVTDVGTSGHSFTNYISNNNATCTADGTKSAKCDDCDATDTIADIGSAKEHSFTNYISDNNATCTADGTKSAKCDNCDELDTQTEQNTIKPHSFSEMHGYSCVACGMHSEEISEFSPIINKLRELAAIKSSGELPRLPENAPDYTKLLYYVFDSADAVFADDNNDANKVFGYSIKDLDGDGALELIILGKAGFVYAVYTSKNDECKLIYKVEECNEYKKSIIADGGIIYHLIRGDNVDGEQSSLTYSVNTISGDTLLSFNFGWRMDGENQVYYKSENGIETVIDNAGYKKLVSIYDYYISTPQTAAKKADLLFFPAVAATLPDNRPVFDVKSSYSAIIDTYKAIYDAVLADGGKFRKADWQDGRYNDYLTFQSYEDYALYNRLLGAICCVQKDNSRTQYGYLLKDFDGNGTDELLLLDMYVASSGQLDIFAIFTLVEGDPVLVDCYGDTRFASIDASGKITVAERRLFSHTKDMTLSVCSVLGDKLIASQVYSVSGTDYTSTTAGLKYTLTENGETTEIDKTAYDEFLKTIANGATTANFANFGKQNYKNSGLNELFIAFNK